jgi:hypothetical protein
MPNGLVVFGLLLAIVSLPPVPRQATDHRSNASHNPEKQAGDGQSPTQTSLTVIEKNCESEQFQNDADCKAAKDKESTVVVSKLPTANIAIQRNADRDIPDWIGYGFGILLAVVGTWGVLVARRGVIATEKAADAALKSAEAANAQIKMMINKERARIVVTVLRPDTLNIGLEPGNQIRIQIENIGPTQAQNVTTEGRASVIVEGFDPLDSMDIDSEDLGVPNAIRPNHPPSETYMFFFIPDQWSEDIGIVNPRIVITVQGSIRYEDIFGEKHITPFKYALRIPRTLKWISNDVAEIHPFSQWTQSGGPKENEAT